MKTLKQYKDEQMKNNEFAKEYEVMNPNTETTRAILETETLIAQKDHQHTYTNIEDMLKDILK